jgi:hypothetical protein
MELLDKHFKPQRTRYAAAHVFRARKQRQSETVAEYVADLRSLISKCDYKPDQLDHQLTEQLAEGLANELHRKKLIEKLDAAAEDNRKFANAVEIALKLEMLDKDVREAASSSSGSGTVNAAAESHASTGRGRGRGASDRRGSDRGHDRGGSDRVGRGRGGGGYHRRASREDAREDEEEDESDSCARCGAAGHDVRDCRIRAYTKCYTCGKPGHIARVCPRRAKEDEPRSPSPSSKARSKTASSSKIAYVAEPDSAYFDRFDFVGGVYETATASAQSPVFSADYDYVFDDNDVAQPRYERECKSVDDNVQRQLATALARIVCLEGDVASLRAQLESTAMQQSSRNASETAIRDATRSDDEFAVASIVEESVDENRDEEQRMYASQLPIEEKTQRESTSQPASRYEEWGGRRVARKKKARKKPKC